MPKLPRRATRLQPVDVGCGVRAQGARERGLAAALLAAALLALPAAASAARLPNACSLLTNAEVRSALGAKIQYRTAPDNRLNASCTWHAVPFSTGTSAHAQLDLDLSRLTRQQFTHGWNRVHAAPVHGVGEVAYTTQNGEILAAWEHGIGLTVSIYYTTNPLETGKRVAKQAFTHL